MTGERLLTAAELAEMLGFSAGGFATAFSGARGARLVRTERPFRESEEEGA
jgi:hypothetical protein